MPLRHWRGAKLVIPYLSCIDVEDIGSNAFRTPHIGLHPPE